MKGRRIRRLPLWCVLLVASSVLAVGSAAGAASGCLSQWSLVQEPSQGKSVNGLAAIGATDVWGLGNAYGPRAGATLAEHWDGTTWSVVHTVNPSLHAVFNAGSAVSSDDVWAVGYYQPKAAYRTLAEHWDGSTWKQVATPSPGKGSDSLASVSADAGDDAWAVGYNKSGARRVPVILHWDGSSWSGDDAPVPGATSAALLGVAALSPKDVWAVGYQSSGLGYRTLTEHWDGTRWRIIASRDPGSGDNVLTAIAARPGGSVWAVGYDVSGKHYEALSEKWNGSSWKAIRVPSTGGGYDALRTVTIAVADDIWAAGVAWDARTGALTTLIEHWDGSGWSHIPPTPTGAKQGQLLAVTTVPGSSQMWASGRAQGAIMETCRGAVGSAAGGPVATPDRAHASPRGQVDARRSSYAPTPTASLRVRDVAAKAGVAETTASRGAVVLDYNEDGLPDFFLGRHQSQARLYRNNGDGTFTEVEVGAFPHHDRHRCATADVNGDGLPDIFCAVGADQGTEVKHNELWIEQPDHSFVDEAAAYGVIDPFGRGRRATFMDVNGDGRPDLVLGNESDRADGLPSPNRLYINQGGTSFLDVPGYGFDQEIDALCLRRADYNQDGWPDLLDCTSQRLHLFRNDAGTGLTDVTASVGLSVSALDAVFTDLNGDGRPDLAVATSSALQILLWSGGTFHLTSSQPIVAPDAVTASDLNGDGAPDLYVVTGTAASCHDPSTGGENCPDMAFVNSGSGSFAPVDVSGVQTSVGQGDAAVPIAYPNANRIALIVLNGGDGVLGPVQLLTFNLVAAQRRASTLRSTAGSRRQHARLSRDVA